MTGWRRWRLNRASSPNFWERLFRTSIASVRLHLRRPIIFFVVIVGSLAMFALIAVVDHREPSAGILRTMFLPAPLDLIVHFQLRGTWTQPLLLIIRVAFVWLVATMILQSGFKALWMLRVSLVYLVGALCLIPILLLALYYVGTVASDPAGELGLQRLIPLALSTVLYAVVTGTVAPMVGRAVSGGHMRPVLDRASVWMLAAVSARLWLSVGQLLRHPGENPFAVRGYLSAFFGLFIQSIVFGALILEGKENG